jgi:hypothetical protein
MEKQHISPMLSHIQTFIFKHASKIRQDQPRAALFKLCANGCAVAWIEFISDLRRNLSSPL